MGVKLSCRLKKINEAPHYYGASCVSMCRRTDTLPNVPHLKRLRNGLVPFRLERPGIEPGAERCISPSVDTIEAPQPFSIPRQRFPTKRETPRSLRRFRLVVAAEAAADFLKPLVARGDDRKESSLRIRLRAISPKAVAAT